MLTDPSRATTNTVTFDRAMVILLGAWGFTLPDIADMAGYSPDGGPPRTRESSLPGWNAPKPIWTLPKDALSRPRGC